MIEVNLPDGSKAVIQTSQMLYIKPNLSYGQQGVIVFFSGGSQLQVSNTLDNIVKQLSGVIAVVA